jgi:hypothetical protein
MGRRGLKTVAMKLREFVPHYTTTQQQIRCPNYDCEATITTRTRLWGGRPARYVSVETCSLLPKQAAEGSAHVNWVPDIPYQALNLSGGERLPRYTMGVSCRETCLMLANGEVACKSVRQRNCVMGMFDGLEIEREIARQANIEAMPFKSPEAFCG